MKNVVSPGVRWRKSSRSSTGECIEFAAHGPVVRLRDSKDPDGPVLTYAIADWMAFVVAVRHERL